MLTLNERIEALEKVLHIRMGSTTDISTWESKPLLCVTFDEGKFVGLDSEYAQEFDFNSYPSGQLVEICADILAKRYLISTGRERVQQLLDWLLWEPEGEYPNADIMDYVFTSKRIKAMSDKVHSDLKDLNYKRSFLANVNEERKKS